MPLLVRFEPQSASRAVDVGVVIEGLEFQGTRHLGIQLLEVQEYETEEKASWTQVVTRPAEAVHVRIPDNLDIGLGLYAVGAVTVHNPSPSAVAEMDASYGPGDFGVPLVEISHSDSPTLSSEDVALRYAEVLRNREDTFDRGFGLVEGSPEARAFSVLVFVKDCYLTRHMRLGQYDVVPFGGLAWSDQMEFIQSYLRRRTANITIPAELAQKWAEDGRTNQPYFVVHFPLLRAKSSGDAREVAIAEVRVLCGVFSLTRLAYPSPFAVFSLDNETKECELRLGKRTYAGNLATGPSAGEHPAQVRRMLASARASETRRLWVDLYREALDNWEPESSYFRLWSLLETMADSSVAKGDPLLDWSRQRVSGRRSKPRSSNTTTSSCSSIFGEPWALGR